MPRGRKKKEENRCRCNVGRDRRASVGKEASGFRASPNRDEAKNRIGDMKVLFGR